MKDSTIKQMQVMRVNTDRTVNEQILLKVLKELSAKQVFEKRADDVPLIKLDKHVFKLKSEKILPSQPLFKLLSLSAIKIL